MKSLIITHKGESYTLEFTRRTVAAMEANGFVASEVGKFPMSLLKLFSGAFEANHPKVKQQKREQIYDSLTNKTGLLEKLVEMYNEPIAALMEDPDGTDEGNATWTASW